jgi:hypothetical protein
MTTSNWLLLMRLELLPEPDLEFGAGTHVDIRFGLRDYGPITSDVATAPKNIQVGFVGTQATIQHVRDWMQRCRSGVPETPSKKPKFRPAFPGFGPQSCFRCDWVSDARLERAIPPREIASILMPGTQPSAVRRAVEVFLDASLYLSRNTKADVIVCAPPIEVFRHLDIEEAAEGDEREHGAVTPRARRAPRTDRRGSSELDFHDYLKARTLTLSCPIQFMRPSTYDDSIREASGTGRKRHLQDPATRAWNFHTALYYKAGGTPWRLLRKASNLESCFIGVSFFHTLDRASVHTSVAQVFNERGEGMILRGGEASRSKEDRQTHLDKPGMQQLVERALAAFENEHHHLPARAVVHKTSNFNQEELEGCIAALDSFRIRHHDLVVVHESDIRVFRSAAYPPLRGTFLDLDTRHCVLYTRGSIPFYEMYPGLYVPRALQIDAAQTEESLKAIAQEILALTKMNWNNTQFDSALPITVRAARQVGDILKYAGDLENIQSKYAFYM